MLLAILYCHEDQVAAAAPACDQLPYGESYWTDIHAGQWAPGSIFETAYIDVPDFGLRERLMAVGIDDRISGRELAASLQTATEPSYRPGRAA